MIFYAQSISGIEVNNIDQRNKTKNKYLKSSRALQSQAGEKCTLFFLLFFCLFVVVVVVWGCCCCCLVWGSLFCLFVVAVVVMAVVIGGGGVAFLVVVVVVVVFKNYLKKSLFSNSLSSVYFVNETKRAHDHCTQTYITLICLACISLSHQC